MVVKMKADYIQFYNIIEFFEAKDVFGIIQKNILSNPCIICTTAMEDIQNHVERPILTIGMKVCIRLDIDNHEELFIFMSGRIKC